MARTSSRPWNGGGPRGCTEARGPAVTRGSEGAVLFDGQDFYIRPPKLVEAVDTLGAGDSFATAFLLSWRQSQLEHGDQMSHDLRAQLLEEALLKAAEFSAKTCLVYGAFGNGKAYDPEQD